MTPDEMRKAGKIMDSYQQDYTDEEVSLVLTALDLVISFLEGAGYDLDAAGSLRQERDAFSRFLERREEDRKGENRGQLEAEA